MGCSRALPRPVRIRHDSQDPTAMKPISAPVRLLRGLSTRSLAFESQSDLAQGLCRIPPYLRILEQTHE